MKKKKPDFWIEKVAKPHMKRMLVVHTHNMPQAVPVFTAKYRLPVATEEAVISLSFDLKMHRTVLIAKILRSESGDEYMQGEELDTTAPCIPEDAADQFTEALEGITHNKRHYIGDAYLVANGLVNIPVDLAEALFRKFGAWEGLAAWEQK